MNNHRLLTGFVYLLLSGIGLHAQSSKPFITLEEIFDSAERNSIQLRPSQTARIEAQHNISVARNGLLPEISAQLSLSYIGDGFTTKRNFSDIEKAPIPHLGTGIGLNITQPVYTGGAVKSTIEIAELKSTAAHYAAELQCGNIRFALTGFYLDIYKYSNLLKVVESNISTAEKVLAEMRARYAQGTALQNDITRYELLLSNLELQRTRIENTLDILNNNLVTMAGLPDKTVIVPDSTILSHALPLNNEQTWQELAKECSPSLKLSQIGVDVCRKAENLARAERRPKIGINAGWTMDGPILVEIPPINRNLSYWYAGIGVSFNISSLYKSNKTLAKSRVATMKAVDEDNAANENVSLAIHADYVRYLEAFEELKAREKSVELAERNYHTMLTRYAADMALITDMLDAANSRIDAQVQLVNASINIIHYHYKLLFTAGKI